MLLLAGCGVLAFSATDESDVAAAFAVVGNNAVTGVTAALLDSRPVSPLAPPTALPAIFANQVTTCAPPANFFGPSTAMAVTPVGPPCPGCDASNNYTFGTGLVAGEVSFDALAVLYFGLTHDGTVDCNSTVRRTLIQNWKNLFATDCSAGDTTCTTGLTHAWRDSDVSNATSVLIGVLTPIYGTIPPFCNASGTGTTDYSDGDPVRTPCVTNKDGVCEGSIVGVTPPRFAGDLGVVLPIVIPPFSPTGAVTAADLYPTTVCSSACGLVAPARSSHITPGFRCPNGGNPIAGLCFVPVTAATNDPRCVSQRTDRCVDSIQMLDGRLYNKVVVVAASQIPASFRSTSPYQFAIDASNRLLTGSFYRIHSNTAGNHNLADPVNGSDGICQEVPFVSGDNSSQIGCLVDSDPCSVGNADPSLVAANVFPGLPIPPATSPPRPVPPAVTLTFEPGKSLGLY
jgi:hypothetical protein